MRVIATLYDSPQLVDYCFYPRILLQLPSSCRWGSNLRGRPLATML